MPTTMMQVSQPVTHSFDNSFKQYQPPEVPLKLGPKVNPLGIEVIDGIVWQGWEPGREYTKNITLKNVKVKTQKIKYNVPNSRFFTTLYPKPIVLSAGTSFSLPITFRPLEKDVYEDRIEFHTKEGVFEVPIKAVLPKYDIQVPETINFNMCAAKDFVEATFDVTNTGDLETDLEWEVSGPFIIEPAMTKFNAGQTKIFKAIFKPLAASVFEATAVCKYGPESSLAKTTTLHGIGKFPHIIVSASGKPSTALGRENLEAVIQFGPTAVGTTVQKMVELHNLSPVRVPFKVDHPSALSRIDTVYKCSIIQGIVPPMASVKVPLMFSPNTVGVTSIDYFNVVAIGNISKSVVKCVGSSRGPDVQLGCKAINFMQIDLGETATRTIDIVNNSDIDAVYQFDIDCNESVFKFQRTTGVLKANTQQTIILTFVPQYPINYHRHVTCMIHNQGPLFLDLLGTCHSELVKPAVLLARHLDNYRTHVERGFSVYPPEQLNDLRREGRLELDDAGALMAPVLEPHLVLPVESLKFKPSDLHLNLGQTTPPYGTVEKPNDPPLHNFPPMDEYFNDGFHSDVINFVPHVSLDLNVADFGNCQNLRVIDDKVINLTNHTKGKITVQWIVDSNKTFSVTPATIDVPPLKSCTFSVSFKPNAPNQLFGSELECYVYYKSLRDYKLVEDTTHCPPWCLTLTCTGHTFMPNNETFLPRYKMDTPHLVFPAVNAKESTYRTVLVQNEGTTPILYDMEKDESRVYSVKPAKGLMKGDLQIFVVKVNPPDVRTYKQKLTMRLNDNNKYDQVLKLWGSAEAPQVLLETQGEMYFKPTCVGTSSKRTYVIKNVSRIPLRFEWKLRYADKKLLSVSPESGIIQPNESQSQTWSFIPKQEQKYVMKPALVVWGQGFSSNSSGGKKKQFDVRAIGEGSIGDIKADEGYLDYGDIVVGSSASKHVTLLNNSSCSLHYRLIIDQTMEGPYPEEITKDDKLGLELSQMQGIIPARSRQIISAMVKPIRRVTYQFAISYQLVTPEGENEISSEPQHLCHILTTGVFPTMSVTDARCYGSAIGISKKQLWSLFSLDNLNVCLDSDPSTRELMYSVQTRHSHLRRPPVYTRAIMDFNFSAAPLDSEPCIVNLMLENTGTVATEWAFLLPSDLHLELEYWAETGEFDEDELHEMKVMDNNLFTIEPKKGSMEPGECRTVTFTYKHTMAGTDRLPVLLKLARGREILLNFIGVTVEPERNYIHFPASKHMFTPVTVGEKISPKQVYELYNGGARPVNYEFDLTPLELIKQENFDQPIFECLNPRGEIPPGRTLNVEWRFSPVEAKTYMVDVPVRVHNGDTAIITFTGVGYDKRIMGETMPITDQQDLTGVPGVQSVAVPGQLAYLSQERVSFGNLPLFARGRRMVFIMNRAKDRSVSFEWHVTCPADSQYLTIAPIRGCLQPGESMMCRVTFIACGVPSFYDLDLVCEVTDDLEYKAYRQRLTDWEHERERQKHEFVITEDDLDADKRLGSPEITFVAEQPPPGLQSIPDLTRSASKDLIKYRTLPPISKPSPDEEKVHEEIRRRKEDSLWEKPEEPVPFLLHLGLTARTHDIKDFQINFPSEYKNFYIDRCLSEKQKGANNVEEKEPVDLIECTTAESDVIAGVMSNVLRGLLDDTTFHDTCEKVIKDPIPYFAQIGERQVEEEKGPSLPGTPIEITEEASASPQPFVESTVKKTSGSVPTSASSQRSKGGTSTPGLSKTSTPRYSQDELRRVKVEEEKIRNKQEVKKLPEFGNVVENLLENTLLNIMTEALESEFNITARPRYIALPKRSGSAHSRGPKI